MSSLPPLSLPPFVPNRNSPEAARNALETYLIDVLPSAFNGWLQQAQVVLDLPNTLDQESSEFGSSFVPPSAGEFSLSDSAPSNGNILVWNSSTEQYEPTDGSTIWLPLAGGTVTGPIYRPVSTPAQITAAQNNYALGSGYFQRLSTDASRAITGIVATANGDERVLINIGAFDLVLSNLSGSSAAANQIITGTGADLTVPALGSARICYDLLSTKWRVIA